jgi:hypothetical protein
MTKGVCEEEVSSSTSSRGSSQLDGAAMNPAPPSAADQQLSQKQGCWEQLQFDNINDARGYAIVSTHCVCWRFLLPAREGI